MTTLNSSRAARSRARLIVAVVTILVLILSFAQPASAGAAKKLGFRVGPSTTTAGQIIVPAVEVDVLDQQNRIVSDSTATVTLSISGGATLYGTNPVDAVGGTAAFSTLRVLPAGNYTLTAASPGLTSATADFTVTGAGTVCTSSGCPTLNDPNGVTPTRQNSTTGTIQVPSCPGAGTNTDFLSYDESAGDFCEGGCIGAAVFLNSDCGGTDPWLIIYRLDKSVLRTDRGAVHVVMYIQDEAGGVSTIPDCIKQGILDPGPVCLSRQYKNGQGDSISEILKRPGDPKIAG